MTSAATTVGRKSVASNLTGIVSICHRSLAPVRGSVASFLSRDSISRRGATGSASLSITSISFRTPGISRGGGAGAARAIWLAALLEDTERHRGTANRMAVTFMPLSAFRPASPVYISLFIFRLLNYIPINNALPTPDELIYHSTGSTAGGLFSSRKPSNRRICHLDLNSSTEGIGLPFRILGRRLISVINVVLALGEILSQQYGNTLDENSNPRLLFV